jgi:hypothetical protein
VSGASGGVQQVTPAPAVIAPVSTQFGGANAIPALVPARPRSVSTRLRRGAIVVTWKAPRRAVGDKVAAYLVSARAGSQWGPVAGTCLATRSARSCTLPNLPRGSGYWVAVSATNLAGPSMPVLRSVKVR